jgi:hypothetical protein
LQSTAVVTEPTPLGTGEIAFTRGLHRREQHIAADAAVRRRVDADVDVVSISPDQLPQFAVCARILCPKQNKPRIFRFGVRSIERRI